MVKMGLSIRGSRAPIRAAVSDGEPAGEDLESSLRQALRTLICGGLPSQDVVGEILGTSGRSLRRRLTEEGTTWRAMVEDVKLGKAPELLQPGNASVWQVAQELGYSDPAHFTRFFRRRAGVTPSRWQSHLEHARDLARINAAASRRKPRPT